MTIETLDTVCSIVEMGALTISRWKGGWSIRDGGSNTWTEQGWVSGRDHLPEYILPKIFRSLSDALDVAYAELPKYGGPKRD